MEDGFCKECGTFCKLYENGLCNECYNDEIDRINNPKSEDDSIGEFDDNAENQLNTEDHNNITVMSSQNTNSYYQHSQHYNAANRVVSYVYSKKEDSSEQKNDTNPNQFCECAICMEHVENGQSVATLPCCHTFHSTCIKKWLTSHNQCPICRTSVRKSFEFEL